MDAPFCSTLPGGWPPRKQPPTPFLYAVIDDIFPADYYAEILEMFPKPEQLRPIAETGRVSKGAYKERSVFFTEAEFQALTPAQ